jgi:septum formation protein
MSTPALLLASESPQRAAILRRLAIPFTVRPTNVTELAEGPPEEVASENALRKALAALPATERPLVLGCDTLVALDGVIYGKPPDEAAARATLGALGGATHEVISGLALLGLGERRRIGVARTKVTFRELSREMVEWYLAGGEWRGRAGGYAIQGAGAALVRGIEGDYENVVGLPVALLLDLAPELLGR